MVRCKPLKRKKKKIGAQRHNHIRSLFRIVHNILKILKNEILMVAMELIKPIYSVVIFHQCSIYSIMKSSIERKIME